MNTTDGSLAIFVLVVAVNVCGLLLDFWLAMTGRPTVTELAYDHSAVAILIVLWQFAGALAIAIHFREFRP